MNCEGIKLRKIAAAALFVVAMTLAARSLPAQESRKRVVDPPVAYPEIAKKLHLTGVVKVQVVIAPDGRIKDVKVIGGHPVLVTAVQDTLKGWKYAPASTETNATLEFDFHP